jgi:CO/xanthine dehydrogenase FAD-binding subunit
MRRWPRTSGSSVRNVATWAGNLMLCHDFPSDVITIMAAAAARITVGSAQGQALCSVANLLQLSLAGRVMLLARTVPLRAPAASARLDQFKIKFALTRHRARANFAALVMHPRACSQVHDYAWSLAAWVA